MTGETVTVHGAGRTDAGVHALAMEAHVDIAKPLTAHRLREGLNALVRPAPVSVLEVEPGRRRLARALLAAPGGAISTASSTAARRRRSLRGKVWHIARAARRRRDGRGRGASWSGTHDFTTFRSVHCQSASPVKTLDELRVERVGDEVHIHAAARSFLHHQVRSMVGCLAMVGRGQWTPEDIATALAARDRAALGPQRAARGAVFRRGESIRTPRPDHLSRASGWLRKPAGLALRP